MKQVLLNIDLLPFWGGVTVQPQAPTVLPFSLTWNPAGFCCQATGTEILNEVVARYSAENYTYLTPPPGTSAWSNYLGKIQEDFVKEFSKSCGEVLEIGAGSTYLAKQLIPVLKPQRYVIADPAIVDESNGCIEIIRSYFPFSEKNTLQKFDTVLSFNALEHADDPIAFLRGIANVLKSNGKALICIPDVENAFKRGDLNELMHEHISYFTPETFEKIAACSSLSVQSMKSEDDTLWAVVVLGRAEEKPMPLPDVFKDLDRKFLSPIKQKVKFIRSILNSRKCVGFHGATNGLCNFLYLSGLSSDENLYFFDADESKHGFYIPGSPNPIASPCDPRYSKMEIMYVSAMTYFETISQFAQSHGSLKPGQIRPLFE